MAGKEEPLVTKLLKYADLMGGKEQANILGYGIKKTVAQAALVNGAASHALDYDDSLLLSLPEIKSITIYVNQMMLGAAHMVDANTGLEGKFCIPYCVANALLRGNTGMQAFTDEKVADPEVKALMKKISLQCDPKIPAVSAKARVEIETTAGRKYSALSDVMKDVPELEVKRVKIKSKYRSV